MGPERQNRALGERIHELEMKVTNAEAEVEQYELENKSLLNKLKVVQVKTDDADYFKTENERLKAEIVKFKNEAALSSNSNNDELEAKIKELERENSTLKDSISTIETEKESSISDLQKELDVAVVMVDTLRQPDSPSTQQ